MIIHVVQQGDTIQSIAEIYEIDTYRLIKENGITNADDLAVGQTIVIVHTKQEYIIEEGDMLQSIADRFGISVLQLLRNNPEIIDTKSIYPGQILVIHYEDEKIGNITTNGYVFPYVDLKVIEKNLLNLTYLSIYSYTVAADGNINDIDDIDIINLAKTYGVSPVMVISNIKDSDYEMMVVSHSILTNRDIINNFINNVLTVLKQKGYDAANINIPNVPYEDRNLFNDFLFEVTERLHTEGFKVFITLTPKIFEQNPGIAREEFDYKRLGLIIDGIVLISYDWADVSDLSLSLIPFYFVRILIEFISSRVDPEKIIIGTTTIGYIWEMPYVKGVSKVNVISDNNAVVLASETDSEIQYNDVNLSSNYYLKQENLYMILFHDARGLNAYIQLIPEYKLLGLGIWNVMYNLPQAFFLINTQYDIINLYY